MAEDGSKCMAYMERFSYVRRGILDNNGLTIAFLRLAERCALFEHLAQYFLGKSTSVYEEIEIRSFGLDLRKPVCGEFVT